MAVLIAVGNGRGEEREAVGIGETDQQLAG